MTVDGAVVALAFTPDGAFLASATSQQILIWRLEDVSVPRARWALGAGSNSNWATEEGHHSLSWDANGQKLAYGFDNNVSPWFIPA
jgi:transducin (beta)-like 1